MSDSRSPARPRLVVVHRYRRVRHVRATAVALVVEHGAASQTLVELSGPPALVREIRCEVRGRKLLVTGPLTGSGGEWEPGTDGVSIVVTLPPRRRTRARSGGSSAREAQSHRRHRDDRAQDEDRSSRSPRSRDLDLVEEERDDTRAPSRRRLKFREDTAWRLRCD